MKIQRGGASALLRFNPRMAKPSHGSSLGTLYPWDGFAIRGENKREVIMLIIGFGK